MKHPLTGDELSTQEYIAWKIQGCIRNLWFITGIATGSVVWWTTDGFGWDHGYSKWNAWASLMALIIESLVGLAMFFQTQRDAVVLREIRDLAKSVAAMEARILDDVEDIEESLEKDTNNG